MRKTNSSKPAAIHFYCLLLPTPSLMCVCCVCVWRTSIHNFNLFIPNTNFRFLVYIQLWFNRIRFENISLDCVVRFRPDFFSGHPSAIHQLLISGFFNRKIIFHLCCVYPDSACLYESVDGHESNQLGRPWQQPTAAVASIVLIHGATRKRRKNRHKILSHLKLTQMSSDIVFFFLFQ